MMAQSQFSSLVSEWLPHVDLYTTAVAGPPLLDLVESLNTGLVLEAGGGENEVELVGSLGSQNLLISPALRVCNPPATERSVT
jgi:hypothetical protein